MSPPVNRTPPRYHSSMIQLPVCNTVHVSCEKENSSVKKGLLWQQRDRLFSRWKERFFVLTLDYLICFHKASKGIARSEMGSFIFKVSLAEVVEVGREDRKGGWVIVIALPREGRLFLRCKNGLDDWLKTLKETVRDSKGRREALRHTLTREYPSLMLDGIRHFRAKLPLQHTLSDSQQETARVNRAVSQELHGSLRPADEHLGTPHSMRKKNHRLSLMTDVDFDSSITGGDLETPPSTPSYRLSNTSRTPNSTPRSSVYQSRPSSRFSNDRMSYFDDTPVHPPRQAESLMTRKDRYASPAATPMPYAYPRNGTESHPSPRLSNHSRMSTHTGNGSEVSTVSSKSSSGSRQYQVAVNSRSPSNSNYAMKTNGSHERTGSAPRAGYLGSNCDKRQQLNACNRDEFTSSSGTDSQRYSSNPRRFSLVSASELTNGDESFPQIENNNINKVNGNLVRVASDRHTSGRNHHQPEILIRERSGSDARQNDASIRKRWALDREPEIPEIKHVSRQPLSVYTQL